MNSCENTEKPVQDQNTGLVQNTPVISGDDIREKFDINAHMASLKNSPVFTMTQNADGSITFTSVNGSTITYSTDETTGNIRRVSAYGDGRLNCVTILDSEHHILQVSDYRYSVNTGKQYEIRRNYFADGSIERLAIVDGIQMDDFDDGEMIRPGELQFMVKNSPLRIVNAKMPSDEDFKKAGYEIYNTDIRDCNTRYRNNKTGETITISGFNGKKVFEYSKGKFTQTHEFDSNGGLIRGRMTIKGQNGAFNVHVYEVNENGKTQVVLSSRSPAIQNATQYANKAVYGYANYILDFRKKLGFPHGIFPNFASVVINETTGIGYTEKISPDGKYKVGVNINKAGDVELIYSEKQSNGTYKTVGTAQMTKYEAPSTLRGFDYKFEAYNLSTGEHQDYPYGDYWNADWGRFDSYYEL